MSAFFIDLKKLSAPPAHGGLISYGVCLTD